MNHKGILNQWRQKCKLESNQSLPILKRVGGGLGGDINMKHKQVRFVVDERMLSSTKEDSIIILVLNPEYGKDKWTAEELNDLMQAFKETCNEIIEAAYIRASIV